MAGLNFSLYNVSSPAPVVEVNSELAIVLLLTIAFCQVMQLMITLYFLSFTKKLGGES